MTSLTYSFKEREVIQGPFGIDEGYVQREHTQPFLANKKYQGSIDM